MHHNRSNRTRAQAKTVKKYIAIIIVIITRHMRTVQIGSNRTRGQAMTVKKYIASVIVIIMRHMRTMQTGTRIVDMSLVGCL